MKGLQNIGVEYNDKSIATLKPIFESDIGTDAVKNLFLVHDLSFYSLDLNALRLFQCCLYESDCTFNMNLIQPFLDHIQNIIWDSDLDLYSYIVDIISFRIQKHGSKTETALIIIGE
jgi:hypothetical protein